MRYIGKKFTADDGKEYEIVRTTNDWGEIYDVWKPVGEPWPEFDPFDLPEDDCMDVLNSTDWILSL